MNMLCDTMKPETKGKIFVGMVISVLAFGLATGTGIFIGANPLSTIGVLNLTHQGQFPSLNSTTNKVGTTNNVNTNTTTTPTQQTTKTTTTPTSNNGSSSNTPPKTNTSGSGNQANSTG